jgi:hypothetical protein
MFPEQHEANVCRTSPVLFGQVTVRVFPRPHLAVVPSCMTLRLSCSNVRIRLCRPVVECL